jgi:hydroxymethylpyrimidine pyrophosphatase-like HAD family hydrolase
MRYHALAADYDGTLAVGDRLSDTAASAIERLRASGRRAILITGRRLTDLLAACPDIALFDYVVAENGALVYEPGSRDRLLLAEAPPQRFIDRLRELGVAPLEVGEIVVASLEPHRTAIADTIRELGLELQVIFNRSAVMVLPAGVNKALGLEYALRKLGLSRHEVVGVGDAENDHSFLERCECAVAVANAVPALKQAVDFVTHGENGDGVSELVDELITNDLQRVSGKLRRHLIELGTHVDGQEVLLPPYGRNILIAGPSGSGKSTITAAIVERLIDKSYQVCVIDPEGDYEGLHDVVALGTTRRAPSVDEVLSILEEPNINLTVNLLGISFADRPEFFAQLIPSLQAMRARTGRPHWIVLDEAHHMLPQSWGHASGTLPRKLGETILVTVHPDHVAQAILAPIDAVIAVGGTPQRTLRTFAAATGQTPPSHEVPYAPGKVVAWWVSETGTPFAMTPRPGRAQRIRHRRKYAEGNMRGQSFYFKGPGARQNLRAQNLTVFCQIADGIDEETWLFHLHRGDYSRWFRDCIKDRELADEAERIERRTDLTSSQTRRMICALVESRYTLPE